MADLTLSESLNRARRVSSLQDYLLLILLTAAFGSYTGIMYTVGLLQSSWISDGSLTTSEASLINSVSYGVMLLPCPLLQAVVHRFKLSNSLLFLASVPCIVGGALWSSLSHTYIELLLANALVLSLGYMVMNISTFQALFHFYTDDQIYLFNCVMCSGMGFGVVMVCLPYIYLEEQLGWRRIQQLEISAALIYLLSAVVVHPRVAEAIGLKTRSQKLNRNPNKKDQNGNPVVVKAPEPTPVDQDESHEIRNPSELDAMTESLLSFHYSISTSKMKTSEILTSLGKNMRFMLVLLSWTLAEPVFNAVMVHQPTRMVQLGYSQKSGSTSLLYNGLVQAALRMSVGFITSANIVSPVRLSEFAKLTLAITTLLSNFFESLAFQTFYMFWIGVAGALINTTDFLLVKDTTRVGREMGIQLFQSTDGALSLLFIVGTGSLVSLTGGYELAFYILAAMTFLAFLCEILYECISSWRRGYAYLA